MSMNITSNLPRFIAQINIYADVQLLIKHATPPRRIAPLSV